MTEPPVQINLNLPALSGQFFVRLQHQLDVIRMLEVAVEAVAEEQVRETKQFMQFSPAAGASLSHADSKDCARVWLQSGFLRDAIEATGLFLDECLSTCGVMRMAKKGRANAAELHHAFNVLPQRHQKLHFPEKLARLEREFGVVSPWAPQALSLNRLRTCIVHRLGVVGQADIDTSGQLVGRWRTSKLLAKGLESGTVVELDRPGIMLLEESEIQMSFVEYERTFGLGDSIRLTPFDLYSTIVTLWSLGLTTVEAVQHYALSVGIKAGDAVR